MILAEVAGPWSALCAAIAAGVVLYALRTRGRRLEVRLGQMQASVEDVSRAVNHRPAGEPTIYELAGAARDDAAAARSAAVASQAETRRLNTRLDQVCGLIGDVKASHDLHLAWHQIEHERTTRHTHDPP